MKYKYNIKDEVVEVFVSDINLSTNVEVCIYENEKYKEYLRTIREDINGKFFTWNKEKVYLKDYIIYTKEQCQEMANNKQLKKEDFVNMVLSYGIHNFRLLIPCKKRKEYFIGIISIYDKDQTLKPCYLDESIYKFSNSNKVITIPDDEEYVCIHHNWYLSDLISFINDGYIKIA